MADVFRKFYAPQSNVQKLDNSNIKTKAESLLNAMDKAVDPSERSERSRCMAIARTHLETAIMWAIKGVTTPEVK